MVKRTSRGSAKSEFLVRFQVEALWPNPKRLRDPAVNREGVGSTPTGHPRSDLGGEILNARDTQIARPSEGIEALNLGRAGSTPALAAGEAGAVGGPLKPATWVRAPPSLLTETRQRCSTGRAPPS